MRKLLRSYWFWVFVLLVAAGATWALWPRHEYPFTVSPDTTYFTGPLNPDGTVNYVAAMNQRLSKGVTPENNAAPLLLRAWGAEIILPGVRDKVFEILQMDPVPEKGMAGRSLEEILRKMVAAGAPMGTVSSAGTTNFAEYYEKVLNRAITMPWSDDDLPAVAAWLKANEEQLALVSEAAKRPRYYMPLMTTDEPARMIDVFSCVWSQWRPTGQMYVARAMNKLHHGDVDGACGELLAAHRLAHLLGQGSTIIEKLIALALEETACRGDAALATSGKLNAAQQRSFLAELEALPKVASPSEGLLYDRLWFLDVVAMCRRRDPGKVLESFGVPWFPHGGIDWNRELRQINAWFNRCEEALCKPNYADSEAAFRAFESYYRKLCARVEPGWLARMIREIKKKLPMAHTRRGGRRPRLRGSLAEVLLVMVAQPFGPSRGLHDRCIMRGQIVKLALALGVYRKEKGTFPAGLSALSPEYLKQIPEDTFAGKPLIYKHDGKGYLLYSVGANMKDDGGIEDEDADEDDVVVRVK